MKYSKVLTKNISQIKHRINIVGKVALIIVDGVPGEGKSTLGIQVLEDYKGGGIDWGNQYANGFKEFSSKIKKCIKLGLHEIIYDESGDYNRRGWASSINKHLNRMLEVYRTFKILIIMIQPSFYKIDNDLLVTGVPRLLLHCHGRDLKRGCFKGYGLWRMTYIKKNMDNRNLPCKQEAYNKVAPNFRGDFYDLPKAKREKLSEISTGAKEDVVEEIEIVQNGWLDVTKISATLDRSIHWVRQKITKMKLKPIKVYKKRKFYDKEIIWHLREELYTPDKSKNEGEVETI